MDDVTASIIIACQTAGSVASINKLGFALGMLGKQAAAFSLQFASDSLAAFNTAQDASWKFGKTFRNSMGTATQAVREFMSEYNLSEQTAKTMLTDTAGVLKGFGFDEKEAIKMSESVSRMGIDLASFTGHAGGAKDAVQAITAAMLGETERMKGYGTVIRMDDKELRELTKTIAKNKGVTEDQARAMAILETIIKKNKDAIGDYKAEGENWTQAQNNQKEAILELKSTLGGLIYELFDVYENTEKITNVIKDISKWAKKELPTYVFAIKSFWLSMQEGAESCSVVLAPVFSGIIAGFKNIVNTGQWMYDNWDRIFSGMSESETNFLHGVGRDIKNTSKNFYNWIGASAMARAENLDNLFGISKLRYGKNQYYYNNKADNAKITLVAELGSKTEKTLAKSGVSPFPKLETANYAAWTNFTQTQDAIAKKYANARAQMELDFEKWMDSIKKQQKDKGDDKKDNPRNDFVVSMKKIADDIFRYRETTQSAILANSLEGARLQSRMLIQNGGMNLNNNPQKITAEQSKKQTTLLEEVRNLLDDFVNNATPISTRTVR